MARTAEPPGWTSQFREIVIDVDVIAHDLRDAALYADALRPDAMPLVGRFFDCMRLDLEPFLEKSPDMTEYAVLWLPAPPAQRRGGARASQLGGKGDAPTNIRVTREDLDEKQVAEARASPHMKAAKAMKTSLVRPLGAAAAPAGDSWAIAAVGADRSPFDGSGCKVAVLDTGIDPTHPAFAGVNIDQEDFSRTGKGDRHGHGTHCAGIIFGRDVGGQRIGIARGVDHALIGKVLDDNGDGDSVAIFEGLSWAFRQGAQIISLSVGIDFPGQVEDRVNKGWPADLATSEALVDFAENLKLYQTLRQQVATPALGVEPLIVSASGNESRRQDGSDRVVAPSLPALAFHLSVGAVGPDGPNFRVADFSNAPPDVVAPGVDIVSAALGGGLIAESGTSMACPCVAGLAALWAGELKRRRMDIDAATLRSHLISSLVNDRLIDFDAPGTRNYGHGMVMAPGA